MRNVSQALENIARMSLMNVHREGVPEERGRLRELHALVFRSLVDEIVGQDLTVGARVAKTVEGDCDEVVIDLLCSLFEIVVLLFFAEGCRGAELQ